MRVVQYKILNQVLSNFIIPDYIWAFESGKSIPEMARLHVGKKILISLDIKDFFPSIHESGLRAVLINAGIGEPPSRTLSELCTYTHFVPQGALTSPKVSNIVVAATFGPQVQAYCESRDLVLSIFADDITVSSGREFETRDERKAFTKEVVETLTLIVESYGFKINRAKTKIMLPHQRNWVTGCVVNERLSLRKSERQRLKAIVHNSGLNGIESEALKSEMEPSKFSSQILGKLNWYTQVDPKKGKPLKERFKTLIKESKNVNADMVFASVASLYPE